MYHFIGYLVKNLDGYPVNFSPSREQAEQFCQGHGVPVAGITQVFEWKSQPVNEVTDLDQSNSIETTPEPITQHIES